MSFYRLESPAAPASAVPVAARTAAPQRSPGMSVDRLLSRHADEAAFIWVLRQHVIDAPHAGLDRLAAHDERLEAHLDALRVAGPAGLTASIESLESVTPGRLFVAATLALAAGDHARIAAIAAEARQADGRAEAISALAWCSEPVARPHADLLLDQASANGKVIGIGAYACHRTDPGEKLTMLLAHPDGVVRCHALQALGELGRVSSLPLCIGSLSTAGDRYWAARSAVLLGHRGVALQVLADLALQPGQTQLPALMLLLAASPPRAHDLPLADALRAQGQARALVLGAGWSGSTAYLPWLLKRMEDPGIARLAGEAFGMIVGLDLRHGFEAGQPVRFAGGPTDDPDDDDVAMDEDRDLPWPDVARLHGWWKEHACRFDSSRPLIMGRPASAEHCWSLLRTASLRRRQWAALQLALLRPGEPLFNDAAPAWRQKEWLAHQTPPSRNRSALTRQAPGSCV